MKRRILAVRVALAIGGRPAAERMPDANLGRPPARRRAPPRRAAARPPRRRRRRPAAGRRNRRRRGCCTRDDLKITYQATDNTAGQFHGLLTLHEHSPVGVHASNGYPIVYLGSREVEQTMGSRLRPTTPTSTVAVVTAAAGRHRARRDHHHAGRAASMRQPVADHLPDRGASARPPLRLAGRRPARPRRRTSPAATTTSASLVGGAVTG